MPKYELAISVADEIDHTPGKHRKKEGDIVAVRPHPWKWGRGEIDECLIVIIECEANSSELWMKLRAKMYSDGHVEHETFRRIEPEEVDDEVYPEEEYVMSLPGLTPILRPTLIGVRRHRIPLSQLGAVDKIKIRNKKYIYQPFKSATQLVEPFDGKHGNHLLTKADVDCVATGVGEDQEVTITWDNVAQLIQDKHDDSYIKPPKKKGK